jgi:hypothetical protein
MPSLNSIIFLFFVLALPLFPGSSLAETTRGAGALFLNKTDPVDKERIALVIGNGDYGANSQTKQPFGPLINPTNDARLISGSLREVGFNVTTHLNLDRKGVMRAVAEFGAQLKAAGADAVGVFYYAGHGIQVDGQNYMIPVNSNIKSEGEIRVKAIRASSIIREIAQAGNQMNLFILDACRNKPSDNGPGLKVQGFEKMDAPAGSMVAFATGSGELSQDGPAGGNSPYSKALAEYISKPGLSVEEVFKNTRVRVMAKTNKRQIPREDSSLTSQFYFVPAATDVALLRGSPSRPHNSTERVFGAVRIYPLGKAPRYATPEEVEVFFDYDDGIEGPLTVTPDVKGNWQAEFRISDKSKSPIGLKVFARWLSEDGPRFDPEKEGEAIQFPHTGSVDINLYQFERLSNRFRHFGERAFRKIKKNYQCASRGDEGPAAVSKCWDKANKPERLQQAHAEAQRAIRFYERAIEFNGERKNDVLWQMAQIETSVARSCGAFERLKSIKFKEWKTRLKTRRLVPVYSSDALFNCLRTSSREGAYFSEIRKGLRYLHPYLSDMSPVKDKNLRERIIGNWLEIFRLVAMKSSDDRMVANGIWKNGLISQWKVFTESVDKHFAGISFPEIVDSPPIIEAQLFRIRNKLGY